MSNIVIDPVEAFEKEREEAAAAYAADGAWMNQSRAWMESAFRQKYMYNFAWLGRPIIQLPADMVAFQEIVWRVKPDLIIETGIAHGGSLMLSASLLALLDYCDAAAAGGTIDTRKPRRKVLGVDIDIRAHNREQIEHHPLYGHIKMIEGSSIAGDTVAQVRDFAAGYQTVMICLDSNHTHDHVLAELQAYAPLTSRGSYCVVFDTIVEDLPADTFPDRPWSPGNNPKTAVHAYLDELAGGGAAGADGAPLAFAIDKAVENKLLLNVTPDGFLRRL